MTTQQTRSGFWNLLARENKVWWGSKRWLIQTLLGVAGLGGLLALALFVLPNMAAAAGEPIDQREAGVQLFFGLGALAYAINVIILIQESIIDEKQSGVAEWVLSKPVSRPAYIVAKLLANTIGILVTLILIPGLLAYVLFTASEIAIPALSFAGAMGILTLHTLFYLALSMLMGVLADSQGTLLAVTLGSALGGAVLTDFIGRLAFVTPWPLGMVAVGMAQEAVLPAIAWLPILSTTVLTVAAAGLAIWRFESVEL